MDEDELLAEFDVDLDEDTSKDAFEVDIGEDNVSGSPPESPETEVPDPNEGKIVAVPYGMTVIRKDKPRKKWYESTRREKPQQEEIAYEGEDDYDDDEAGGEID